MLAQLNIAVTEYETFAFIKWYLIIHFRLIVEKYYWWVYHKSCSGLLLMWPCDV